MKADAFISHASADSEFAEIIGRALEAGKLNAWMDSSDIKFGSLLRNQIQSAISDCRVLVLLWSEAAFKSRWVMAEIFTAFYLKRFIIPCVLDTTRLPQFLANAAYLDRQREKDRIGQELCRAVRAAPAGPNEVAPVMVSEPPEVRSGISAIAAGQHDVMGAIFRNFNKAAEVNRHVSDALGILQKIAPKQPMVLNLAGYQCKNEYTIKHWDTIQAGQAPEDPLLDRSERYFFESLCVNPFDESAVNGLGSVLFYERELDAAEFFQRRAIELHLRRTGKCYKAAQDDLDLVLKIKRQQEQILQGLVEKGHEAWPPSSVVTCSSRGKAGLTVSPTVLTIVVAEQQPDAAILNLNCRIVNRERASRRLRRLDMRVIAPYETTYDLPWTVFYDFDPAKLAVGGRMTERCAAREVEIGDGESLSLGVQFAGPVADSRHLWAPATYTCELRGLADDEEAPSTLSTFKMMITTSDADHIKCCRRATKAQWDQLNDPDRAFGIPVRLKEVWPASG